MRWSSLAIALFFLLFTTSTTAYPVPRNERKIFKRARLCDQQIQVPTNEECGAKVTSGSIPAFDWPHSRVLLPIGTGSGGSTVSFETDTLQFLPASSGKVERTTITDIGSHINDFRCDHILGVDLVAALLDHSGLCTVLSPYQQQTINHLLNSDGNLSFLHHTVYDIKAEFTKAFNQGMFNQGIEAAPFPYLAFEDYIEQNWAAGFTTAGLIDNVLTGVLPAQQRNRQTVTAVWDAYKREVTKNATPKRVRLDVLWHWAKINPQPQRPDNIPGDTQPPGIASTPQGSFPSYQQEVRLSSRPSSRPSSRSHYFPYSRQGSAHSRQSGFPSLPEPDPFLQGPHLSSPPGPGRPPPSGDYPLIPPGVLPHLGGPNRPSRRRSIPDRQGSSHPHLRQGSQQSGSSLLPGLSANPGVIPQHQQPPNLGWLQPPGIGPGYIQEHYQPYPLGLPPVIETPPYELLVLQHQQPPNPGTGPGGRPPQYSDLLSGLSAQPNLSSQGPHPQYLQYSHPDAQYPPNAYQSFPSSQPLPGRETQHQQPSLSSHPQHLQPKGYQPAFPPGSGPPP